MMDFSNWLREYFPPAQDNDINEYEERLAVKLPTDYKKFLKISNGGTVISNFIKLPDGTTTSLGYVNGFNSGDEYDIVKDYQLFRSFDRIPIKCLVIADDPNGNRFILSLEQEHYGKIYFWDHEQEPEDGGDVLADFPNITKLADSFEEFIQNLEFDE